MIIQKIFGIPNFLTIASTSYKNSFQYSGVPLTQRINENALSLATKLLIASSKLFLTIPAVSVPSVIVCIAKVIGELKWSCPYRDLAKKM